MTYMSMPSGLEPLVRAGRLHCLPSLLVQFETARMMFVSGDVMHAVSGPFANEGDEELVEFRQQLDAFLEGGEFTVAEDPYCKPGDAMLARVSPINEEIWDIRSVVPHPGIRCLGGFCEQDVFVALTWDYRENIESGDGWEREIARCQGEWKGLFGALKPFSGANLDAYLTNYIAV